MTVSLLVYCLLKFYYMFSLCLYYNTPFLYIGSVKKDHEIQGRFYAMRVFVNLVSFQVSGFFFYKIVTILHLFRRIINEFKLKQSL